MGDLSQTLARLEQHDPVTLEKAFASFYPELKRIAHARLRGSGLRGTLQTTALVHEGYLKLAAGHGGTFADRSLFLAYASRALRSIVVDAVREERAQRRGGDMQVVTLDTAVLDGIAPSVDLEQVNDALEDLARIDSGLARLVEMRFFGGLTEAQIAEALDTSERTVRREWAKARALLLTLLED